MFPYGPYVFPCPMRFSHFPNGCCFPMICFPMVFRPFFPSVWSHSKPCFHGQLRCYRGNRQVGELKALLKERGLKVGGLKARVLSKISRMEIPTKTILKTYINIYKDYIYTKKHKQKNLSYPYKHHLLVGGFKHEWIMFHNKKGMSSFPLTNCIIFQDCFLTTNQKNYEKHGPVEIVDLPS